MQAVGQILADPGAALAMRVVLTELDPRGPSVRRRTCWSAGLQAGNARTTERRAAPEGAVDVEAEPGTREGERSQSALGGGSLGEDGFVPRVASRFFAPRGCRGASGARDLFTKLLNLRAKLRTSR
jgi:hypothetical protein